MKIRIRGLILGFCSATSLVVFDQPLHATPYASGVVKSGTSVSFILNEPADALTYTINGGAPIALDGTTKGAKMFTLGSPTDTFSISAEKTDAIGYTVPTGGTIANNANGLTQTTNASGLNVISDDTNSLNWFLNPRGVDSSKNPNAPNFGTTYIAVGATGTTAADPLHPGVGTRTTDDGIYAVRADGTDAFGYGDTAQNPPTSQDGAPSFSTASSNSPWRLTVGPSGDVYVADFADVNSNVFVLNQNLTSASYLFNGFTGSPPPLDMDGFPTTPDATGLPAGQNHGSVAGVWVEGSLSGNDLVVYTLDEDLNSAHALNDTNAEKNDRNSIWQYNVGGTANINPLGFSTMPTKVVTTAGLLGSFSPGGIVSDMQRGADGKFYYSQNRSAGGQPGLMVADASGNNIYDSLSATRSLLGDPSANDILTNIRGMAVSPDQKWVGMVLNNSDVAVVPLVDGIPDLANRLIVDTGGDVNFGRDIGFDAAGNLIYVASGQNLVRTISPGGHTLTTLSFDGSQYAFASQTIVPSTNDADFNNDGVVDGADFLVWQKGQGLSGQTDKSNGDANGDGNVNAADLVLWQTKFGGPPTAGAAAAGVPEPATDFLAAVVVIAMFSASRPRVRVAVASIN